MMSCNIQYSVTHYLHWHIFFNLVKCFNCVRGWYIFIESRQRGRFAGFSLYVSITDVKSDDGILSSTLCYNNSYQLPSLNFTTLCSEYARYVIFYNERLTNVAYPEGYEIINVYTELCEVIVQGKKLLLDKWYCFIFSIFLFQKKRKQKQAFWFVYGTRQTRKQIHMVERSWYCNCNFYWDK